VNSVTQSLLVKPGMEIRAQDCNALVMLVDQITPQRSAKTRRRHLTNGVITSTNARAGRSQADHEFKVAVSDDDGTGPQVRFSSTGFIGGFEPTIKEMPISRADPVTGLTPAVPVPADQFAPMGGDRYQALLYFRVTLSSDWIISTVNPEVLKDPPTSTPWTAWKLIAFLLRDGQDGPVSPSQMLFFNQSFEATQRRPNGYFKPWFSAE